MRSVKKFNSIIALTLCVIISTPSWSGRGGQDGGGGNVKLSTAEDVRNAIQSAHELYMNRRLEMNPLLYASSQTVAENDTEARRIALSVAMPLQQMSEKERDEALNAGRYFTVVSEYLKLSRLDIREKGPCLAHGGKEEADASVSKNDYGADICFSIERLQRFPATGLLETVSVLFAHELTHVRGYGEREANLVQDFVAKHVAKALNQLGDRMRSRYHEVFGIFMVETEAALFAYRAGRSGEMLKYAANLQQFVGRVSFIRLFLHDLLLASVNQPARPDLLKSTEAEMERIAELMTAVSGKVESASSEDEFAKEVEMSLPEVDKAARKLSLFLFGSERETIHRIKR